MLEPPDEISGRVRPLVGRMPEVHADRDEALHAHPQADAEGDVTGEVALHFHAAHADPERAASQQRVQRHDQAGADEAQFLGGDREDEIGVRFGQVVQLLHRIARATPVHSPRPTAISALDSW